MGLRAVKADTVYKVRSWFRMRGALVISLVLPLIMLLAMGAIFDSASLPKARLRVADLDQSEESGQLLAALASAAVLDVAAAAPPGTDLQGWMHREALTGYLQVPAGFGAAVRSGAPPNVTLVLSSADAFQAAVLRDAVQAALAPAPRLATQTVEVPPRPYSSFLLPGVVGMNVLSVGLLSSFVSVVELRHQGLLRRLAVSPMTKMEWLLARMLGQTLIILVMSAFLVLAAWLAFRTPLAFSWWGLAALVAGTLVFSGIGTLIGARVKQVQTGASIINLVILPASLVSGSFFDPSVLPPFLRWLAVVSPLTYLNDGLRAALVYGRPEAAAVDVAILSVLAVAVFLLGSRLIRWTEDK